MKMCGQCGQIVAEEINTCPACGAAVAAGRAVIDDYRIDDVLHEGYSSILCKARRVSEASPVMIRIFTPQSGVDARLARRLTDELEKLQALPESYFVRHLAIRQSRDGVWYRISEWVDARNWGSLLASGRLKDTRTVLRLFYRIASILDGLHRIGHIIPHLILDDILVYEDDAGAFKVMIDYKLSRFLDPQLDRPGPMLARLLSLHPDIVNQRPLDQRSDIWSLGKVFVEILSANPDVADPQGRVDSLPVPPEVRTLLRLMLSDDRDLRPNSMADVCAALNQVSEQSIRRAEKRSVQAADGFNTALLQYMNLRMGLLAMLVVAALVAGGMVLYHLAHRYGNSDAALRGYANRYAGSVAFVVVDYWLLHNDRRIYANRSEGTAFLVDRQGHLLTNRHVACPWLSDRQLLMAIGMLRHQPEQLEFAYRMYLWFDGQRAFSRLPVLSGSDDVEDTYIMETAFRSQGPQTVRIAGVAPAPVRTRERVHSPLGDDFAVLKIDAIPEGLQPLPLAEAFDSASIAKLTPLITLGFPLGSQTQAETVNVSVTRGHVRRAFESMFQVDASIHPGNSGGPFIDVNGEVVGMATVVAVSRPTTGPPIPLSDIGLVLPITKAAAFLEQIRAGATKWNGELDLTLEQRLEQITTAARRRDWETARELADAAVTASGSPPLMMAAAVMHLCSGNSSRGRHLLEQVLSINAGDNLARLMIQYADWLDGRTFANPHKDILRGLDWRSPDEFLGHLSRLIAGTPEAAENALPGGYTASEKSWLHWAAGLVAERHTLFGRARSSYVQAVLTADVNDWNLYLALSRMEQLHLRRIQRTADPAARRQYHQELAAFDARAEAAVAARASRKADRAPILAALRRPGTDLETRRTLLERLRGVDAQNNNILIAQAYYAAMSDDWRAALTYARRFLALPGRNSAGKLSLGLLEAGILHRQGKHDPARRRLAAYRQGIRDSWYRELSACLLDPALVDQTTARADESPAYLLTGHTALGLWAEGSGDTAAAVRHYREALGSYMDHLIEYDFATVRFMRLRSER